MTIIFSTEFPIDHKNSVEDVLQTACKWITGSQFSIIKDIDLEGLENHLEKKISNDSQNVVMAFVNDADSTIGGVRYAKIDNDLEWITYIVVQKNNEQHLLSFQISCEALNPTVWLPPPKNPYFIRLALKTLGGGMDGEIPVANKPFELNETEFEIAANLIQGQANNKLPIVYVSIHFDGTYLVNPKNLSLTLSGLAHVFVEPSRDFSLKVKQITRSRNVFGGTIGVYWPASAARNSYYLDEEIRNEKELVTTISHDIRQALANRRLRSNCTWSYLKETITRKRYEILKAKGSTELKEYVELFDADTEDKVRKISDLEQQISLLNADVNRLNLNKDKSQIGFLEMGEEQDFYHKEIRDVVIDAMEIALRSISSDSRRAHILNDLLKVNKISGQGQKIESEIKTLFKTYREMDAKTKSALNRLCFAISEEGKHYKLTYNSDPRYAFPIAKTPSDIRAGKNIAGEICRSIF